MKLFEPRFAPLAALTVPSTLRLPQVKEAPTPRLVVLAEVSELPLASKCEP